MAKKKKQKVVPCTSVHQHDDERKKRLEAKKRHYANLMAKYMMERAKAQAAANGDTSTPTQYDGMQEEVI